MRRVRNVKVLATLGPSSASEEMIRALFEAGADAFRLNMSHGSHKDVRAMYDRIRSVEQELGRPICILVDLQGPKLRVGEVAPDTVLEEGASFRLELKHSPGDASGAELPHKEIFEAIEPGTSLLLDDGKVHLEVVESGKDYADTRVIVGGPLSSNKGVNVPDVTLPVPALSPKDRRDLDFAMSLDVDWVALSFVQRPDDVAETKKIVAGRAAVMAKIEKPRALAYLDEIVDIADGLMVARGDLGVELPVEQVPGIQKAITRAARHAGKPVVVATQMLESMIDAPVPTRAEVSDVANAVFEGADAVMLSGESAIGDYPVEAVAMMDRVAQSVEADEQFRTAINAGRIEPETTSADAITLAARQVAETLNAAAIVCYTGSGSTGLRASRERPEVPILVLTPFVETARRLALAWGVHCVETEDATSFLDMVIRASRVAESEEFAKTGDRLVITAGVPFGTPGRTNILRIATVGTEARRERN
ncbi:MAG: pyruvate kinase [Alphaproteobacteria bacterium]|nr:pyruvate kinase [Alphaproteobacteria bacterium]